MGGLLRNDTDGPKVRCVKVWGNLFRGAKFCKSLAAKELKW